MKLKSILLTLTLVMGAFIGVAAINAAPAGADFLNVTHYNGLSESRYCSADGAVSGVHLWICKGQDAYWEDQFGHNTIQPYLDVYCYLNGNNNSMVACSSFHVDTELIISGNDNPGRSHDSCGQGSPYGFCSSTGFRVDGFTDGAFGGVHNGCQGNDWLTGGQTLDGAVSTRIWNLAAYVNGIAVPSVSEWGGPDNRICFS